MTKVNQEHSNLQVTSRGISLSKHTKKFASTFRRKRGGKKVEKVLEKTK